MTDAETELLICRVIDKFWKEKCEPAIETALDLHESKCPGRHIGKAVAVAVLSVLANIGAGVAVFLGLRK